MARSSATPTDSSIEPLTTREMEILRLIVTGMRNDEIGIQLFLSEGTVKWHNKNIFAKLGVRNRAEAIAKAHSLRLFHEPPTPTPDKPRYHLPTQHTAFIGRVNELQEIINRIHQPDCRLLSLIGAGGSGKTRLAIQSATQLLPHFRDGVFFALLEPISSPDQVIATIAQACRLHFYEGVDPRQQVFDFLQQKEALLLLDNFEHLLEAKSDVLALLEQTRHLKIVVTSRIPLHLSQEWVLAITGMAFPDQQSLQNGEEFDAVRLFLACAKRSGKKILLGHDLPHIASICQWTQGIPLAIELAASWLRTLTCQEIAQELRADTNMLTTPLNDLPERHQSMRRVFQHSWNLLAENDQKVLRVVSIFRGGFTLSAFRTVTGASLTDLARLIDTSLVHATGNGRYDLHPLIAQFLQEYLVESSELPVISAAHAAYFADFLQARCTDLKGGRQLAALNEIQADFENVSAAWIWMIDHEDYVNLEKAWEAFSQYTQIRGGEHLFSPVRKFPLTAQQLQPLLIYLYSCLPDLSEEEAQQTLAVAKQHQDIRGQAFILRSLGGISGFRNEHLTSLSFHAESLKLFRELDEAFYIWFVLIDMSFSYGAIGEKVKRGEVLQECLRIFRSIDNPLGIAPSLHEIASDWFWNGEYSLADPYVREALAINQEFGNLGGILFCSQFIGHMCLIHGDFDGASQLYHTALTFAENIGGTWRQVFAVLLGVLANSKGDYVEANIQLNISLAVCSFHPFITMFVNWAQSITHCGIGQWQTAQDYLCAALKFTLIADVINFMLLCLSPAAPILWNDGKRDLAVEIMGLAFSHPKSEQGWFVKSPLGNGALERMKSEMDAHEFDEAWQRGTQRDLHETSAEILAMFPPND